MYYQNEPISAKAILELDFDKMQKDADDGLAAAQRLLKALGADEELSKVAINRILLTINSDIENQMPEQENRILRFNHLNQEVHLYSHRATNHDLEDLLHSSPFMNSQSARDLRDAIVQIVSSAAKNIYCVENFKSINQDEINFYAIQAKASHKARRVLGEISRYNSQAMSLTAGTEAKIEWDHSNGNNPSFSITLKNNWNDAVSENNLSVVKMNNGKAAFVLDAEKVEVPDEFKEELEAYKLKVVHTKIKRGRNVYHWQSQWTNESVIVEDVYFCRELKDTKDYNLHKAVGSTLGRAIGTYNRRVRKEMFDMMGV